MLSVRGVEGVDDAVGGSQRFANSATLITLLVLSNLWHRTTRHGERWVRMVGAIAVPTVFLLLIARVGYPDLRNRRAIEYDRP